jgi:hypothetical protein
MTEAPVVVTFGGSSTTVHADGRIETQGTGRPVSELLWRLRATDTPAAAAAQSPELARLVKLLDGRVDLIELSTGGEGR